MTSIADGFSVTVRTEGRRAIVAVRGELDLATAGVLRETLVDLPAGTCEIVLDAEQLAFCDSTGLSVLLGTARRSRLAGARFALRRPSPQLTRLLDLAGVADVFPVDDEPPG